MKKLSIIENIGVITDLLNSAIPNFTLHNIAPLITLANTIQILRCGGQAITKLERDNHLSL